MPYNFSYDKLHLPNLQLPTCCRNGGARVRPTWPVLSDPMIPNLYVFCPQAHHPPKSHWYSAYIAWYPACMLEVDTVVKTLDCHTSPPHAHTIYFVWWHQCCWLSGGDTRSWTHRGRVCPQVLNQRVGKGWELRGGLLMCRRSGRSIGGGRRT